MVFFWACEVTETKAAVVKIPESYVLNVCHATLASAATEGVVSLGLEAPQMDQSLWKGVVAHLGAAAHAHQVKLDLVVGGGAAQVKFYVAKGTGKVNLTGYFQPGPPEDLFDSQLEITPAASTDKPAKNNKKRARDATVTWDQAASDSESEEKATATKPAEPVQKQAKKDEPKKAPAPQQPTQPQQNGADGEKKKRKKNKNKNKDKKDN